MELFGVWSGGINVQDDALRLELVILSWALSSRSFFVFSCDLLWTVAAGICVEDSVIFEDVILFSNPHPPALGNQLHKNVVKCFAFWIKYRNLNWHVSLNTTTARWQYCSLYSVFHLWKETVFRFFSTPSSYRRSRRTFAVTEVQDGRSALVYRRDWGNARATSQVTYLSTGVLVF